MTDAAWPRILSDPGLARTYEAVLAEIALLGPFDVQYRKSAVQLVRPDGAGILAMAPGVDGLMVTLPVNLPLTSPRAVVGRSLSDGAGNQQLTLDSDTAVDDEVRGWLAAAYRRA